MIVVCACDGRVLRGFDAYVQPSEATWVKINDNSMFGYGRGVDPGELDSLCRQGGHS